MTQEVSHRGVDRTIANIDGLPRRNGELVFAAPWESRAFGMAVVLDQQGAYGWDAFRGCLVSEIQSAADRDYYASWLGALERLLLDRGLVGRDELEARTEEYRSAQRTEVF
jgi:nitrile hydratase accessory protein